MSILKRQCWPLRQRTIKSEGSFVLTLDVLRQDQSLKPEDVRNAQKAALARKTTEEVV